MLAEPAGRYLTTSFGRSSGSAVSEERDRQPSVPPGQGMMAQPLLAWPLDHACRSAVTPNSVLPVPVRSPRDAAAPANESNSLRASMLLAWTPGVLLRPAVPLPNVFQVSPASFQVVSMRWNSPPWPVSAVVRVSVAETMIEPRGICPGPLPNSELK